MAELGGGTEFADECEEAGGWFEDLRREPKKFLRADMNPEESFDLRGGREME